VAPVTRPRSRCRGHLRPAAPAWPRRRPRSRGRGCLEEIKTIRGHPDEIPANRRLLHWAQLQTYGALFCRARGLHQVALALVYYNIDTRQETVLPRRARPQRCRLFFEEQCRRFAAWSAQEAAHRAARDEALRALAFPDAGLSAPASANWPRRCTAPPARAAA
jgi:DNA excision repair protein ERCC-2